MLWPLRAFRAGAANRKGCGFSGTPFQGRRREKLSEATRRKSAFVWRWAAITVLGFRGCSGKGRGGRGSAGGGQIQFEKATLRGVMKGENGPPGQNLQGDGWGGVKNLRGFSKAGRRRVEGGLDRKTGVLPGLGAAEVGREIPARDENSKRQQKNPQQVFWVRVKNPGMDHGKNASTEWHPVARVASQA